MYILYLFIFYNATRRQLSGAEAEQQKKTRKRFCRKNIVAFTCSENDTTLKMMLKVPQA